MRSLTAAATGKVGDSLAGLSPRPSTASTPSGEHLIDTGRAKAEQLVDEHRNVRTASRTGGRCHHRRAPAAAGRPRRVCLPP